MAKRKPLDTAAFASAAIARPDPVEAALAPAPMPGPVSAPKHATEPAQSSRAGRVQIQGYFPKETRRKLKTLAAAQEKTVEDLLGEALELVFNKYDGNVA
jgi:hypothetical protein